MRVLSSVLGSMLLCAVMVGCVERMPVEPDAGEPELELGTGDMGFVPLEDGATLERLEDTYDLPYVFVSLRTEGIRRTGALIEVELRRLGDDTRVSQELRVRGSFVGSADDDRLIFPAISLRPSEAEWDLDEPLMLVGTVTDSDGVVRTGEREIRIVRPL